MRVLFVVNPEKAHLLAMAPLGWALRTAGHEVRVASQPAFAGVITQAGLPAVPVGRDADLWQLLLRDFRYPDWSWQPELGLPAPYDVTDHPEKATWRYLVDGYAEILHMWHRPANLPTIAGLVDLARHWRPDLVIWEPLAYGGPIAARVCGAAHARLPWSVDAFGFTRDRFRRLARLRPPADRADPLGDWLASYARKHAFAYGEDMVTGQFTIEQLPASLRIRTDLHLVPMRYTPYGGAAVVSAWLWERPVRPRVALTMGLSLTDHDAGYAVNLQDLLDALGTLDIELVATVAVAEQARLARVPANARLLPYVPLHALVPTCVAVIHHGGFGTLLTTARDGVPQLAVPWDFDSPALARRAAEQGATLTVRADQATGTAVRDAVLRLLHEPGFRERAAALRDEILAMPTPHQLVPELEELTASYRDTGN